MRLPDSILEPIDLFDKRDVRFYSELIRARYKEHYQSIDQARKDYANSHGMDVWDVSVKIDFTKPHQPPEIGRPEEWAKNQPEGSIAVNYSAESREEAKAEGLFSVCGRFDSGWVVVTLFTVMAPETS